MVRLMVTLFVFAMLACGGSDTGDTGAVGGAAPAGESASAPGAPEPPAMPAASAKPDPKVQSCLGLIRQGKYEPAVPVCLAALEVDPGNQQVQNALNKARAETAKAAAAKAAGEGAAGQASSKVEEATGAMPDMPGQ